MKVFCSTSFQSGNCPKCGASLAPVKYCSAIEGNTTTVNNETKVDWKQWKTTTTTTKSTQYYNIQLHTGYMCLKCCNKAENRKFVVPRVVFGIGVISFLIALIMIETNDWRFFVPAIIAAITLYTGWKTVDEFVYYNGLMTSKKYYGSREIIDPAIKENINMISRLFIEYIPRKYIPKGRVLLSTGLVENMEKGG
ncbi:MAG: hypothetical protein LBF04_03020 [Prevotellaceae bacterium]|jgi:hypothetical protein|nr:hypothetical protein [Prevotellaceae bacterium]